MATCKGYVMKVLVLLCVYLTVALGAEHVPVLIWETRGTANKQVSLFPSLSKLSSDDFSDFFVKKVSGKPHSKPVVVAFVEENLSVEDFSWRDAEGHVTFPHLENLTSSAKHVDFFPSVHAPLKGLKRLGYRWQNFEVEDQENDLTLPSDGGVVLVVKLGDARVQEDRPDFLRRHDYVISEIYNDLIAKNKDVVALYTSHHSSWVEPENEPLVRRVRNAVSDDGSVFWNGTDILFYATATPVFIPDTEDKSRAINISKPICTRDSHRTQEVELFCKFNGNAYSLDFKFTLSNDEYWTLQIFIIELRNNKTTTLLSTDSVISAPLNFSYHCSQDVEFKNGTMALYLQGFQIQPYVVNNAFDDAYDCVWFFTAPIWAGIFVTALLGFILILGITMIMDINTMDRFDDPKGKTITINVSE